MGALISLTGAKDDAEANIVKMTGTDNGSIGAQRVEDGPAIHLQPVKAQPDEHEMPGRIGAWVDVRQLDERLLRK